MTTTHAVGLAPASDADVLKQAYSCFPSGVVAVCCGPQEQAVSGAPALNGIHDPADELIGMAASAFTTVSLDPPLVSVCVQNTSTTWPRLRGAPAIGVSVFARDQSELCRQLAGPAARRFTGITPLRSDDGAVFIPDAAAHLSCTIHDEVSAGDHTLVLLRIESLRADPDVEPLVFHASTFRALEARRDG